MTPYEWKILTIGLMYLFVCTFILEGYLVLKKIREDRSFDGERPVLLAGIFTLLLFFNTLLKAIPFVLFFSSPIAAYFAAVILYGRIILLSKRGSKARQQDLKLITLSSVPLVVVFLLSILN